MARFIRLACLSLLLSPLWAVAGTGYWAFNGAKPWYFSAQAACEGWYASSSYSGTSWVLVVRADNWCTVKNGASVQVVKLPVYNACGPGLAFNGTSCIDESTAKCQLATPLGGPSTSWSYAGEYPGYGGGYCIGGCSYDLHGSESYDKKSGMSAAVGSMKPTGGTCSSTKNPVTGDPSVNTADPSTVPPPSSPNPSGCASGGVPYKGTVNGKSVTVCGSATKTSTTDSTQKDSSSTRTDSGGTTSGSGSETTTTKTTCADGKCTTTTTKTDSVNGGASAPGGSQGSQTETKTESQADYCKDNPTQPICKEDGDSSFGGSCGAFNCDGDAIQCAIAREQHQRNCQLFEDRTPMTEIGEGAAGAGNRPSDHPGNNPDDIDVGARMAGVARENPFGDGCPRDFDLAVMGNVVTVPLSNACDVLKLMGEIAVAFAFIAGARIVMSGVSSGAT